MSATEPVPARLAAALAVRPSFDLDYGVDDPHEPAEIAIYDPFTPDVTTRWLTVDVDAAVDLADMA